MRHLLLSHIHLDHAGAAGVLVREHPGLQVHVSEIGAPHLVDPSRLEASARRLYGDDFDRLWGELAPVPTENVHVVGDETLGLATFPTRVTRATTSATSTARARSTRATRRACGSGRASSCCRRRRRPTSTSRRGTGRWTSSSGAILSAWR